MKTAVFIADSQAALCLQANDLSAFICDHASQAPAIRDLNALFLCHQDFALICRHLMTLLQADELYLLCAQTFGG